VTSIGEQWLDTGFPLIRVTSAATPPLRRGAFKAHPRTHWRGIDRDGVRWSGSFAYPMTTTEGRRMRTGEPLSDWEARQVEILRALQRDWIARGGRTARSNPMYSAVMRRNSDEELRELERQLAASPDDLPLAQRVWLARERRGDPEAILRNGLLRLIDRASGRRKVRPIDLEVARDVLAIMLDRDSLWVWSTGRVRPRVTPSNGTPLMFAVRVGDMITVGIGMARWAEARATTLTGGREINPRAVWPELEFFGAMGHGLSEEDDLPWNTSASRGATPEEIGGNFDGSAFMSEGASRIVTTTILTQILPWAAVSAPDRRAFRISDIEAFVRVRSATDVPLAEKIRLRREVSRLLGQARENALRRGSRTRSLYGAFGGGLGIYGREVRDAYWQAIRESLERLGVRPIVPFAEGRWPGWSAHYGEQEGDPGFGDPAAPMLQAVRRVVHQLVMESTGKDWLPF
jgi:hypothetical protein